MASSSSSACNCGHRPLCPDAAGGTCRTRNCGYAHNPLLVTGHAPACPAYAAAEPGSDCNHRTVKCPNWDSPRGCAFGRGCKFAHGKPRSVGDPCPLERCRVRAAASSSAPLPVDGGAEQPGAPSADAGDADSSHYADDSDDDSDDGPEMTSDCKHCLVKCRHWWRPRGGRAGQTAQREEDACKRCDRGNECPFYHSRHERRRVGDYCPVRSCDGNRPVPEAPATTRRVLAPSTGRYQKGVSPSDCIHRVVFCRHWWAELADQPGEAARRCRRGYRCAFAHEEEQLREQGDPCNHPHCDGSYNGR